MSVATTIVKNDTYTGLKPVRVQPVAGEVAYIALPIKFPTAAPVANDVHLLCKLLPGLQVLDWDFFCDDLDSGGPTTSMSLGETPATLDDVTVVYKSGITIGQTGGLVRHVAASAAADIRTIGAATLNTERTLALKWDTASTAYVADKTGVLVLKVTG